MNLYTRIAYGTGALVTCGNLYNTSKIWDPENDLNTTVISHSLANSIAKGVLYGAGFPAFYVYGGYCVYRDGTVGVLDIKQAKDLNDINRGLAPLFNPIYPYFKQNE